MNFGELHTKDFPVNARVAIHPSTDEFHQGERVGYVVKATTRSVYLRMHPSGRELRFSARDVKLLAVP